MSSMKYLLDQLDRANKAGQPDDVAHILALALEQCALEPNIVVLPNTIVSCAICHDTAAEEYRLRRVMGRYNLLCYKGGSGCWEHSPVPNCEFKDNEGIQCSFAAEATVAYGADQITKSNRCAVHIGPCLLPEVGKLTIYPIGD